MSDRQLPSRVILLDDDSCGKVATGLSSTGDNRWHNAWCFCGTGSDNVWMKQVPGVSVNHCHLFEQLTARDVSICQEYYKQMAADEKLNGKTWKLNHQPLLLDSSRPVACGDSVQLGTVTCCYQIPSNVECLDLAASCLQRISGSYFINRKLRCVMSQNAVCKTNGKSKVGSASEFDHRKRYQYTRAKPHERDQPPASTEQVMDDDDDDGSDLQEGQCYRCTRSVSKQILDVCDVPVRGASHSATVVRSRNAAITAENNEMSLSKAGEEPVESALHSSMPDTSASECDSSTVSQCHVASCINDKLQTTTAKSPARKTKSAITAAAAGIDTSHSIGTDRYAEMPTAVADGGKLLKKCGRQRKVIANKKEMRHSKLHTSQIRRNLRSRRSSPRQILALADISKCSKRLQSADDKNSRRRRHLSFGKSARNAGLNAVTAKCEVVVPKLGVDNSGRTKQKRKPSAVLPVSASDVAVPSKHVHSIEVTPDQASAAESMVDPMFRSSATVSSVSPSTSKSQNSDSVASSCDASKLTALNVDTSFDCDYFCNSPTSPLPVSLKMADSHMPSPPAVVSLSRRSVFLLCRYFLVMM